MTGSGIQARPSSTGVRKPSIPVPRLALNEGASDDPVTATTASTTAMIRNITALSVRLPAVERFVKGEPSLLVRDGRRLPEAMKRSRVTQGEVMAAIREAGIASLSDVAEAVLETDGSMTVVPAKDEAR